MNKRTLHIISKYFIVLFILVSCNQAIEETQTLPIESVSLKIEGDLDLILNESGEENQELIDIVEIEYNPNQSNLLTFHIQLKENHILSTTIYHFFADKVWETPTNFPVYPAQDSSDHWKYSFTDYQISNEVPIYNSHLGKTIPRRVDIDAFEITNYNAVKKELKCRFNNLQLHKSTDSDKFITINGTLTVYIPF